MCKNGYIKLIDFGMARILKSGQLAQTYAGTVEYMAPEMLQKTSELSYNKSIDWWSLGILLFEMLTGVTPFFNQNSYKVKDNIRSKFKVPSWPTQRTA